MMMQQICFLKQIKNQLKLSISALTFANTNYILTKLKSSKEAREILRKFKVLVEVVSLDDKITELAWSDETFPDFEDGLQYILQSKMILILSSQEIKRILRTQNYQF